MTESDATTSTVQTDNVRAKTSRSLDNWAIGVSIVALVVSAASGWFQYKVNRDLFEETRDNTREQTANATWEKYMELGFQNPDLSSDEAGKTFVGDGRKTDMRYFWFMERIMMAGDQVAFNMPTDEQWKDTFISEFRKHRRYFLHDYFLLGESASMSSYCTYRSGIRGWLRQSFPDDQAATTKLNNAEAECQRIFKQRNWHNA